MAELRELGMGRIEPDPKNPRRDFGDLKALAATFDLNPDRPGEPLNPPIVVAFGHDAETGETMYRIVDGERRYRAMRLAKRGTCHAIVCGSMEEADALVQMIATDDKRPLTDAERSMGVQRMLDMDVPVSTISKASGLDASQVARVRKGRAAAGDGADQMSLDRLMALADFEGNEDAIRTISGCRDADLARVVKDIERRAKEKADIDQAAQELYDAGGEFVDVCPEGYVFALTIRNPGNAFLVEEHPDWVYVQTGYGITAYRPKEADPERERIKSEVDRLRAVQDAASEEVAAWMSDAALCKVRSGNLVVSTYRRMFFGDDWNCRSRREKAESVLGRQLEENPMSGRATQVFMAWVLAEYAVSSDWARILPETPNPSAYTVSKAKKWAEMIAAMKADGFKPGDAVSEMLELAAGLSEDGEQ